MNSPQRQVNMDYALCHAIHHRSDEQQMVLTFYDINCQYNKNLRWRLQENWFISLPDGILIQLGIGLWHIHGHQAECFARYVPNFIRGAGQVDGKVMETLWSSLNIISPSAHGMATPHQQELLDFQMNDSNFLKMVKMYMPWLVWSTAWYWFFHSICTVEEKENRWTVPDLSWTSICWTGEFQPTFNTAGSSKRN